MNRSRTYRPIKFFAATGLRGEIFEISAIPESHPAAQSQQNADLNRFSLYLFRNYFKLCFRLRNVIDTNLIYVSADFLDIRRVKFCKRGIK